MLRGSRELCQLRTEADWEARHGAQPGAFARPHIEPPIWAVLAPRLPVFSAVHNGEFWRAGGDGRGCLL